MSTQPTFNHPELVVQTLPKAEWILEKTIDVISNGDVQLRYLSRGGTMTRLVFLNSNLEKIEENITKGQSFIVQILYNKDFTREDFFEGEHVVYSRKIQKTGEILERWFHNQGKILAIRRTINGKLSCTEGPAVDIQRPNDLRREEFWHDGILSQVAVIDDKHEEVIVQNWKDGKCVHQFVDPVRMTDIHPADLVVQKISEQPRVCEVFEGSEKKDDSHPAPEKKTLEKKTFNLISAEEARGALKQDDERIQEILDAFETQRREGAPRGERRFNIKMNYRLEERVTKLFKEAGYHVNVNLPFYWVEF